VAANAPVSGGTYEYGYRWLHPALGFTAGWMFLAKDPEVFVYDDDGNLLSDGRWEYTWDAENRLVEIEEIRIDAWQFDELVAELSGPQGRPWREFTRAVLHGDSGSPARVASGEAAGVVTHLGHVQYATRITHAIAISEAALGAVGKIAVRILAMQATARVPMRRAGGSPRPRLPDPPLVLLGSPTWGTSTES
jgi:YD repeat-containing protein